jgi:hypothetical protein
MYHEGTSNWIIKIFKNFFFFSSQKLSKYNKTIDSLNSSIDHQSFNRSHSRLNNEILIKVGLALYIFGSLNHCQNE